MPCQVFCGATQCAWGNCENCKTGWAVGVLTGLDRAELEDLGGFGCRGTCGAS